MKVATPKKNMQIGCGHGAPRAGTGGCSVARIYRRSLAPIGTGRKRTVGCAATTMHPTAAGHACRSVTSIRHGIEV